MLFLQFSSVLCDSVHQLQKPQHLSLPWAFKCLFQFHSVCSSVKGEGRDIPHTLYTHVKVTDFFSSLYSLPFPGWNWMLLQYHEKASPVSAIFIAWQKVGIALVVWVFYTLSSLAAGKQLGYFSSCIGTHIWCCLPLYGISKTLRDDSVVTEGMFAQQCELPKAPVLDKKISMCCTDTFNSAPNSRRTWVVFTSNWGFGCTLQRLIKADPFHFLHSYFGYCWVGCYTACFIDIWTLL